MRKSLESRYAFSFYSFFNMQSGLVLSTRCLVEIHSFENLSFFSSVKQELHLCLLIQYLITNDGNTQGIN